MQSTTEQVAQHFVTVVETSLVIWGITGILVCVYRREATNGTVGPTAWSLVVPDLAFVFNFYCIKAKSLSNRIEIFI
jgi:uncharacterized protein with PQ loop repeat